jgi:hypothetical protein
MAAISSLVCPFCGSATKGDGSPFSSAFSLTLHVAGKARTWVDKHTKWVKLHVPSGTDLKKLSINQVEELIRFDFLRLLETTTSGTSVLTPSNEASQLVGDPSHFVSVSDASVIAYRLLYKMETELHQFVFNVLKKENGEHSEAFWKSVPTSIKNKCMERATGEKHAAPMECYVDFLDLAEIIQKNPDIFSRCFSRLDTMFKDPKSEFHRLFQQANQVRKQVMHPLKGLPLKDESLGNLEQLRDAVTKLGIVED